MAAGLLRSKLAPLDLIAGETQVTGEPNDIGAEQRRQLRMAIVRVSADSPDAAFPCVAAAVSLPSTTF